MAMFKSDSRNWVEFRKFPDVMEVDFHWSNYKDHFAKELSFDERMHAVKTVAMDALIDAKLKGKRYVLFTHGNSTSRPGRASARSQIRNLMRSKEATPYIIRSECLQHETAFLAVIRSSD